MANACAVQVMRADRRGLVDLVTQLSVPQQQLASLPAAASVILSAFEPLALTRPDEPLVAAPGTSIVVPLRHGPAPYPVNVSAFVLTGTFSCFLLFSLALKSYLIYLYDLQVLFYSMSFLRTKH